ncbi:ketoacyl-ACP synthase III family protein [Micromonospora sp. CPCC 205371]|nr:ketoacyl-ACP synthase III family protein [Micromonospora sp. CPCC 205371]
MRVDEIFISGLGSYLPEPTTISSAVAAGLLGEAAATESGQVSVLIADDIAAPDMAVLAARRALDRCGTKAAEIDMLVHSSVFFQGPEMWSPQGYILRELGAGNVPAVELRQGCNGMLTAMEFAIGQFAADPSRRIALLTTGDNFNAPTIDRWRGAIIGLYAGDAGTAVVLSTEGGIARVDSINSALFPEIEGMARGAEPLFPPPAVTGRPIDMVDRSQHFAQTVRPLPEAIDVVRKAQVDLVCRSLDEAGLALRDVRKVVYINGARWLMERNLTGPLGIPLSRTTWDYGRTVGHLGASDHVASLDHLLSTGEVEPGDRLLLVGGAPGWSVATAVVTILEPEVSR